MRANCAERQTSLRQRTLTLQHCSAYRVAKCATAILVHARPGLSTFPVMCSVELRKSVTITMSLPDLEASDAYAELVRLAVKKDPSLAGLAEQHLQTSSLPRHGAAAQPPVAPNQVKAPWLRCDSFNFQRQLTGHIMISVATNLYRFCLSLYQTCSKRMRRVAHVPALVQARCMCMCDQIVREVQAESAAG